MGEDGRIDCTATIHPEAELAEGVEIGPRVHIGAGVSIGRGCRIDAQAYILGPAEIGEDTHIYPHVVIGTEPQDLGFKGERTGVRIGRSNIIREFSTIHRGTEKGGGITVLGDHNYLMAYSHVGHDSKVGSHCVFTNNTTLGGHVQVGDRVNFSAFTGIHQFCRIGKFAFTGGFTVLTQDVLPFCRIAGMRPPRILGVNSIALRRTGFSRDRIQAVKAAFRLIFFSGLNTGQAVERILEEVPETEDREEILEFIKTSKRGFHKKQAEEWEIDSES